MLSSQASYITDHFPTLASLSLTPTQRPFPPFTLQITQGENMHVSSGHSDLCHLRVFMKFCCMTLMQQQHIKRCLHPKKTVWLASKVCLWYSLTCAFSFTVNIVWQFLYTSANVLFCPAEKPKTKHNLLRIIFNWENQLMLKRSKLQPCKCGTFCFKI